METTIMGYKVENAAVLRFPCQVEQREGVELLGLGFQS